MHLLQLIQPVVVSRRNISWMVILGFALLLFLIFSKSALAQNNFIAHVNSDKLEALKSYVSTEHGEVSQIISLDNSHLVGFHGDQGLKAKVRRFNGVLHVSDNPEVQWIDPAKTILLGVSEDEILDNEKNRDLAALQWGLTAVNAPKAWSQSRGQGVRVAVIDNGIDAGHQDLKPNLNIELSKSFVPNESWDVKPGFGFHHGTHIAGIIGAADNKMGTLGVAPDAELIALKVASERTGSGDFLWLLEAIVYAVNQDIAIANIGLGVRYPKQGPAGLRAEEMKKILDIVAGYANKNGLTLIAPAGDDSRQNESCCYFLPASAEAVLSVSATAPVGWAHDPYANSEKLSSYAHTGTAHVDFAAPGGDVLYPGRDYCIIAEINRPCWGFDLVFSTVSDGWGWAAGSSISTAFLSGIAALIHSKETEASPALIKHLLVSRAIPKGKNPGKDSDYGFGFANAFEEEIVLEHDHTTVEIVDGTLPSIENEHVIPQSFELYQNYPNPFNPQTTINFHIPKAARVQVAVFDLMGSQVATLVDRELEVGCYNTSWNGRDGDGRTLTSGVYMYKIDAESFVDAKVMTFANN